MPRARWVIFTLIPFGWLTWAAFAYAGRRARSRALLIAAGVYFVVMVATFVLVSVEEDSDSNWGGALLILLWLVGAAHAFIARPGWRRRVALIEDPSLQAARQAQERRAFAHELARSDPDLARTAGLGQRGGFEEGGVVDVNHASVEDIADLPQVSAALAREIVAAREQLDGFSSLEDMGMALDLPGDLVEDLRGHVVFLPR